MKVNAEVARRILLAQAIEESDVERKLLRVEDLDRINNRVAEELRLDLGADGLVDIKKALSRRAALVLEETARSNAFLVSLQGPPAWRNWALWGMPIAAFIFGVATDRVANPHRVDLLSLPFLLIVLWNLTIYGLLLVTLFRRDSQSARPPLPSVWDWVSSLPYRGRRFGIRNGEATVQFRRRWAAATADLDGQRNRGLLHLSAATWGAGVAVSLVMRGVVIEYRTGWESTFLSAEQVHSILSILFMPVVACFAMSPFTLQEISSMRFDVGADGAADHGRRWALLYAGLLVILVALPRLALAGAAWRRVRSLSRQVRIDLSESYFQRLIDQLCPARVRLCLYAHREEDRSALQKVLAESRGIDPANCLVSSSSGDSLVLVDAPQTVVRPKWRGVWQRLLPFFNGAMALDTRSGGDDCDVVLHVVGRTEDLDSAVLPLHQMGKPVLVLVNSSSPPDSDPLLEECRKHKKHRDWIVGVLSFDAFARCWVQEHVLLKEISRYVPATKQMGYARLETAWNDQNTERFKKAMTTLSIELLAAAREKEPVHSAPFSIRNVLSSARRDAHNNATNAAGAILTKRVSGRAAEAFTGLCKEHGVDAAEIRRSDEPLAGSLDVQLTVNTPQAGVAGAATGATVGATVDLLTGGLTLGVGALLGAIIGGAGGSLAAAWKNSASTSGTTTVQLSDNLLQALVVQRLLGYLDMIHVGRYSATHGIVGASRDWKDEVLLFTEAQRNQLLPLWSAARMNHGSEHLTGQLEGLLEAIAKRVLIRLYPAYH